MAQGGGAARGGLRTLDRALGLLEMLCQSNGGLSLTELSKRTSLPKSTVHRLLGALIARRLVAQDTLTQYYVPGIKLFELSQQALQKLRLRDQALPELRELCRETRETVHLAILDDGDVIYIDKEESPQTIRMFSAIGKRGPAHCTGVGKVLLSGLSDGELSAVIRARGLPRFTENTITDPEDLRTHLQGVRERGYAIDDREHESDIRCIACPVFDHRGVAIASISLTVPAFRAAREEVEGQARVVRQYADRISRKMGWAGSEEGGMSWDGLEVPASRAGSSSGPRV
jgi:DNA-binding IclR family transcriptional regulator